MTKKIHRPAPASFAAAFERQTKPHLTQRACLRYHSDEVWDVSFSHDGSHLASSSADNTTIVYSVPIDSADSFKVLYILRGHSAGIASASWSPDDRHIVTCSQDETARVWNTSTAECCHVISSFSGPVTSCVWSTPQHFFLTSLDVDKPIALFSTSGKLLHYLAFPHKTSILGSLMLPDKRLVSFDNKRNIYVHAYNLNNGQVLQKISTAGILNAMCPSRSGKYALAVRNDGVIEMLNTKNMDMVKAFLMKSYGQFVIKATFGGEHEEFVASGSEDVAGNIYIWSTITGSLLIKQRVYNSSAACNCVAWNPKMHSMLATAGDDRSVRIFSICEDENGVREGRCVCEATLSMYEGRDSQSVSDSKD